MASISLYVGGLDDDTRKDDLEREFSRFGKLTKVWIARNPLGFGFVDFENDDDANEAIKEMNGATINGAEIRVSVSYSDARRSRGREQSDKFKDGLEEFGGYWNKRRKMKMKEKNHLNFLRVQKLWDDTLYIHTEEEACKCIKNFLSLRKKVERDAIESFTSRNLLMAMREVFLGSENDTRVDPKQNSVMLAKMSNTSLDESQNLDKDGSIISKNICDVVRPDMASLLKPIEDFELFFKNIYRILEEGTYLDVYSMDIVSIKYDWVKLELLLEEQLIEGRADNEMVPDKAIWVDLKDIIMLANELNLFFIKIDKSYKLYYLYQNSEFDTLIIDEKSSKMFFGDTWFSLVKENSTLKCSNNIFVTSNKDYVVCCNDKKVVIIHKVVGRLDSFKILKIYKRCRLGFFERHYNMKLSFNTHAQKFVGICERIIDLQREPFLRRLKFNNFNL